MQRSIACGPPVSYTDGDTVHAISSRSASVARFPGFGNAPRSIGRSQHVPREAAQGLLHPTFCDPAFQISVILFCNSISRCNQSCGSVDVRLHSRDASNRDALGWFFSLAASYQRLFAMLMIWFGSSGAHASVAVGIALLAHSGLISAPLLRQRMLGCCRLLQRLPHG